MIKGLIWLFLSISGHLLNYLLVYLVIFHSGITNKKSKWVLGIGILCSFEFLVFLCSGKQMANDIVMLSLIIVPMYFLKERKKKWFGLYPAVAMGTSMINICSTFVVGIIFNIPEAEVTYCMFWKALCANTSNILVLFSYIFQRVRKSRIEEMEITRHQYIVFYMGLACSFIIIGISQLVTETKTMNTRMLNAYGLSISLICMLFVIMSLWQGIIVARGMKYRQQIEMYEEYMKMQEQAINETIRKDEKMRRFRHDMSMHLTAIKSYLDNNENKEAEDYYNDMLEQYAVYDLKSYTGNQAVDAIICKFCNLAEQQKIQMGYVGNTILNFEVSIFDLCTIISNLLQNAIEACAKEIDGGEIEVGLYDYECNLYILVKNTVTKPVEIKDGQPVASKSDSRYHGLGIGNVKNVVAKYDGSIEYLWKNGWFYVKILL